MPDPRSRSLPDGVHGLTEVYDEQAHRWTDAGWAGRELAGAVIYELHVGTFTPDATLDSAIERLDHLVELGITHVELLPVNAVNGSGTGATTGWPGTRCTSPTAARTR